MSQKLHDENGKTVGYFFLPEEYHRYQDEIARIRAETAKIVEDKPPADIEK
jgi:hypothetical protein